MVLPLRYILYKYVMKTGSNKAPGLRGKYHLSNHQWQSGEIIVIASFDYLCLCRLRQSSHSISTRFDDKMHTYVLVLRS